MRLHIDCCFIGLDVAACQQLAPHHTHDRRQHFTDSHDPATHRGAADVDARVTQQDGALTIERTVIAVFADDRVDDNAVRHQALVDDSRGYGRCGYSLLLTLFASTLFTLDDLDEILGRLHIENFADFVADHLRLSAAAAALALLWRAGDDLLHARQIGGQRLATGMRTPLLLHILRRTGQRLAFALGSHFNIADAGFKFQQFQLEVAQLLTAGAILGDSRQAQPLFKNLYLQLRILQLELVRVELAAHRGKKRWIKMSFELFEK